MLELIERRATALAVAISDTSDIAPEIANLQGIALASVWQVIFSEAGRRAIEHQSRRDRARTLVAHPDLGTAGVTIHVHV